MSVKTPDEWLTNHRIRRSYENLQFDRKAKVGTEDLMGVGHVLMEKALLEAALLHGVFCLVDGLPKPVRVIAVSSKVTGGSKVSGRAVFGITGMPGAFSLLKDWEVLRLLNGCALKPEPAAGPECWAKAARDWVAQSSSAMPSLFGGGSYVSMLCISRNLRCCGPGTEVMFAASRDVRSETGTLNCVLFCS